MKIQHFALWSLGGFFLIIAILSGSFYTIERSGTLRYLSESINQSIFGLEEDIQKSLQTNRMENLQTLLDQTSAIDGMIKTLSLSLDGETIAISSSRSMGGRVIGQHYLPLNQITDKLIKDSHLYYSTEIPYFIGAQKESALLLIELDEAFVFERLNRIAFLYGIVLFLVLGIVALGVLSGVRTFVMIPLVKMTRRAQEQKGENENHFIEELSILDQTLSHSFYSLHVQKADLKEALNEAVYLDSILRTVADINQFLITAKNTDELMSHSCIRLSQHPGYELCFIGLKHGDSLVIEASSDITGEFVSPKMKISNSIEDVNDPNVRAMNESLTVVIEHIERENGAGLWQFIAEKGQFGSLVSLPLISAVGTPPLGVITLYSKRFEGFELKEIAMLEELAGDIGFAVHSFRAREQLEYHLTTDAITDLPNRFSMVESLANPSVSALAIINIDRFSDINEVYGVGIGDAILTVYAQWLLRQIKPHRNISLFKLGSDEYGLMVTNCHDLHHFMAILEELIISTQKETFSIEGIEVVLTITIGVARNSERVLEHTTAALKQAKKGRRGIELFTIESKKEQENNVAWYKKLKKAIDEDRIIPYFQPIVDNHTGLIIKYEALIRLLDDEGNVVSPLYFLEIAKKTKLYPELTKMMVEKVIARFKHTSVPVSLNLSTQDLINPELADYLESIIRKNSVAHLMIFEILESEGIENYSSVSEFVDRFKSIGCSFALDDFGSGYSNFDHLLKLNIDTLKIDGSLIKNLPHDRNAQIFVKHICDFAHEMGISVVAEFVANEAIYVQVKAIGIEASQGYYFYEPSASLIEREE